MELLFLLFALVANGDALPFGTPVTFSDTGCLGSSAMVVPYDMREIIYYRAYEASVQKGVNRTGCTVTIPVDLKGQCFPDMYVYSYLSFELPRYARATFKNGLYVNGLLITESTFNQDGPISSFAEKATTLLRKGDVGPLCDSQPTLLVKSSLLIQSLGAELAQAWLDEQDVFSTPTSAALNFGPTQSPNSDANATTTIEPTTMRTTQSRQSMTRRAPTVAINSAPSIDPIGFGMLVLLVSAAHSVGAGSN